MKETVGRIERKRRSFNLKMTIYSLLVFAFIYLPIVVMVIFSFNDQKRNYYWKGFTFKWYEKLFTDSDLVQYLSCRKGLPMRTAYSRLARLNTVITVWLRLRRRQSIQLRHPQ